MPCPNCGQTMAGVLVENQNILHCPNCGGSFFDDNGINRISVKTAETLAADAKNFFVADHDKKCPRDGVMLEPTTAGENVPPEVALLRCSQCMGVFAFPDDLVKFKKAQEAKIDYFKLWGIPLPSVRSIAIVSVILFVTALSFTTFTYWQQQNISRIQAQDLVKNIYIRKSNRYLLISFKTPIALKSRIIFQNATTNQTIEKVISDKTTEFHELITSDINTQDEVFYQIILEDAGGKQTKTEVKRLTL